MSRHILPGMLILWQVGWSTREIIVYCFLLQKSTYTVCHYEIYQAGKTFWPAPSETSLTVSLLCQGSGGNHRKESRHKIHTMVNNAVSTIIWTCHAQNSWPIQDETCQYSDIHKGSALQISWLNVLVNSFCGERERIIVFLRVFPLVGSYDLVGDFTPVHIWTAWIRFNSS